MGVRGHEEGKAAHYGSCQEVSHKTVQSLIGLEVFLIPFPFIVSSWSLRGGQSPVVAVHSYCGGKGGGWWTSPLGFYLPGCRASAAPGPLSSKPGQSCRSPVSAAATGEHGLGLVAAV